MMADQNPHPGDTRHSQFPWVARPPTPPPPFGLDIDKCINIDWNNEDHVSSLTAHKLRLYLKQLNLQVSGEKQR